MKKKGIGTGIFLILAGVLVILMQQGILKLSMFSVFITQIELTIALVLIVVGMNALFKKYSFVKVLTWLSFFVIMITYGYYTDGGVEASSDDTKNNQNYVVESFKETKNGKLELKLSALSLNMGGTEANLMDVAAKNIVAEHNVDYDDDNEKVNVKFGLNDKVALKNIFDDIFSEKQLSIDRKCDLNISSNIAWNLDVKLEAVDSNLNYTSLKLDEVDIKADASNVKLYLGDESEKTTVEIDADASKVEVYVPAESGVRFKVDGAANASNFDGMEFKKDGKYYITNNYNDAKNKIDMDVEIDAGSFKIMPAE